jgi:hypothetical protein
VQLIGEHEREGGEEEEEERGIEGRTRGKGSCDVCMRWGQHPRKNTRRATDRKDHKARKAKGRKKIAATRPDVLIQNVLLLCLL